MPPRTPSDVLRTPHAVQVDLLSQALLREFMHRRGFTATLATFDAECPRSAETIASRALMADLMALRAETLAGMREGGLDTFMEMLCAIRVRKRTDGETLQRLREEACAEIPERTLQTANRTNSRRKSGEARPRKKKRVLMTIDELLDQDHTHLTASTQQPSTELNGGETHEVEEKAPTEPVPTVENPTAIPADEDGENAGDGDDSDSDTSSDNYAAALRRLRAEEERGQQPRRLSWVQSDAVTDNERDDAGATPTVRDPPLNSRPALPPPTTVPSLPPSMNTTSMGEGEAARLCMALVGTDRRIPPSFLRQGVEFDASVRYGLRQRAGGPCGVMAALQGYLLREVFKPSEPSESSESSDPRGAVVRAMAAVLGNIAARGGTAVVVVDGNAEGLVQCPVREIPRTLAASFRLATVARESVEDAIAARAAAFGEEGGAGIFCFLLSCILTRGIEAVRADMDVEAPLIVEHGYCSQELVNLLLGGCATSGIHDGSRRMGEMQFRGVAQEVEVGQLSMMEARGLTEVGKFFKYPRSPIWVVHNESHYTVMFMKKDKRRSEESTLDVWYYDQQGGQDEEIRLILTIDNMPLPAKKKSQLTPYLNDIIRTMPEWKNAKISWNGTEPLL